MRKKVVIFLSILAVAGMIISCGGTEDCPAYSSNNDQDTEQKG
jgi:hypothetical protein